MPKTIEYHTHGVRELYLRPGCHSCWDCKNCVDMTDPTHYMCRDRGLTSHRDRNFPYDNTRCRRFKDRHGNK